MASDNGKWYYIRSDELYIALASIGVKKWFGFEQQKPVSSVEDVNRLLACLWEDGIISFGDGKILIRDRYRLIFEVLKEAVKCFVSVNVSGNGRLLVSYAASGYVVTLERSPSDSLLIRMTVRTSEEWPAFIVRECLDFDTISSEIPFAGNSIDDMHDMIDLPLSEIVSSRHVLSVFDEVDMGSASVLKRMIVKEDGLKQYIIADERKALSDVRAIKGGALRTKEYLAGWLD